MKTQNTFHRIAILAIALVFAGSAMLYAQQKPAPQKENPQQPKTEMAVKGTIAKIEGNKITVNEENGKATMVEIDSPRMFKVGEKVIIEHGKLKKDMAGMKHTLKMAAPKKSKTEKSK